MASYALLADEVAVLTHRAQRGGRQRQRAREALELLTRAGGATDVQFDSKQGKQLVLDWCFGKSTPEVQRQAQLALDDQLALLENVGERALGGRPLSEYASRTLTKLASLGCHGRYPSNCYSELTRWLGEPRLQGPQPLIVPIKVPKPKTKHRNRSIIAVTMRVLMPHLLFASLFLNYRGHFDTLFLGVNQAEGHGSRLREFWSGAAMRGDPRLVDHPMRQFEDWMDKNVPFSMHGDAVPVIRVGKPGRDSVRGFVVIKDGSANVTNCLTCEDIS